MITRRTLFAWIVAGLGRVAAVLPLARRGPPEGGQDRQADDLAALWFHDGPTGRSWPAEDVFQWLDWHIPADVIDQARRGLVESIGPAQLQGLLERRSRQHAIEFHRPCSTGVIVIVRHWAASVPDIRPFLNRHGLVSRGTFLQFQCLENGTSRWSNVADHLAGLPGIEEPDVEKLVRLWERRHEPAGPADWSPALRRDVGLRWPRVDGPGIPWAALGNAWRHVPPLACPACGGAAVLAGFGPPANPPRRGRAVCDFLCLDCLTRVREPVESLSQWCRDHLDPEYRPILP